MTPYLVKKEYYDFWRNFRAIRTILKKWDCTIDDLKSRKKNQNISECRAAFSWYMYNVCGRTYMNIGQLLDRHHSTVIHHLVTISEYMEIYPEYRFMKEL